MWKHETKVVGVITTLAAGLLFQLIILAPAAKAAELIQVRTPPKVVTEASGGELVTVTIPGRTIVQAVVDDSWSGLVPVGAAIYDLTPSNGEVEDGPDGVPFSCYDNAVDCAARVAATCRDHGGQRGKAKLAAGTCTGSCGDGSSVSCTKLPPQQ